MAIKHLELFAGIGGFRKALDLLKDDCGLMTDSIGFSEIDQHAIRTYKANFCTKNEIEVGDIVSFVSDKTGVERLPDFNLLTGGFPCQAFSMMGKKKGFDDVRGNVFFQIMDIASAKKPDFLLLENVRNLVSHNKGETLEVVLDSIRKAGYKSVHHDVFNTKDFGLAQNRNRVFIFASRKELPKEFVFTSKAVTDNFSKVLVKSSLMKQGSTVCVLEKEVENKYYLSETIKPTILANGSKNFKSKSEIDQDIARPLTATMAKMHRACQDNYFSNEYILSGGTEKPGKNLTKQELAKRKIRKLTPREAFMLQGFSEAFLKKAKDAGVSNTQLYKQAGNAVSVNAAYAILHYLFVDQKVGGSKVYV